MTRFMTRSCIRTHSPGHVLKPGTLVRWEIVHSLIEFQLYEEIPPEFFCFEYVKFLRLESEHKSSSHPLTTLGDGSAPSPSLVCAKSAVGFASWKAANHLLSHFLVWAQWYRTRSVRGS